jgi:hypothetical protein
MRLFLLNLCGFLLVTLLLWVGILLIYTKQKPNDIDFNAATRDKQQLLEQQSGPRLILVGGSNLIFGIHSAEIERRTSYRPVNMGLNVGDGLAFMLNTVEPSVRPGDIVIVSPEYEDFGDYYYGIGPYLFAEVEHRPANLKYFAWGNLMEMMNKGFIIAGGILRYTVQQQGVTERKWIETKSHVYRRDAFNSYGDLTGHYDQPNRLKAGYVANGPADAHITPETLARAIERLNSFSASCARQGARVFYSFPPLPKELFERHRTMIQQLAAQLQRQLSFPLLDTPEEITFPTAQFFDAYYHLAAEGGEKRTAILIEKLRERGITNTPGQDSSR